MNRRERIHTNLTWCVNKGILRSFYGTSRNPGMRWVLEGVGFTERVYGTAEVEAFLLGATEGRTTGLMEGAERWEELT